MCKSLTNYFPRNNDFLVTYFGKTHIYKEQLKKKNPHRGIKKFSNSAIFIRNVCIIGQ